MNMMSQKSMWQHSPGTGTDSSNGAVCSMPLCIRSLSLLMELTPSWGTTSSVVAKAWEAEGRRATQLLGEAAGEASSPVWESEPDLPLPLPQHRCQAPPSYFFLPTSSPAW